MDWRDYVELKDTRLFLTLEKMYCYDEIATFGQASGREQEVARARVLAKRLEFLAYWIEEGL